MKESQYQQKLAEILEKDQRYAADAYMFVAEAVSYTTKRGKTDSPAADNGKGRHISGGELLDGIRAYALEQFGPLALDVFLDWGVDRTEDFGNIVFNLVENGLLGASDEDSVDDFKDGYDFRKAFLQPFLPPAGKAKKRPRIP